MPITSASSPADIRAAYLDSLGYEAANSLPMAQAFLQACLALQLVMPMESHQDRGGSSFNVGALKDAVERVRLWIATNPGSPGGGTGRYLATDCLRGPGGDPQVVMAPYDQGGG